MFKIKYLSVFAISFMLAYGIAAIMMEHWHPEEGPSNSTSEKRIATLRPSSSQKSLSNLPAVLTQGFGDFNKIPAQIIKDIAKAYQHYPEETFRFLQKLDKNTRATLILRISMDEMSVGSDLLERSVERGILNLSDPQISPAIVGELSGWLSNRNPLMLDRLIGENYNPALFAHPSFPSSPYLLMKRTKAYFDQIIKHDVFAQEPNIINNFLLPLRTMPRSDMIRLLEETEAVAAASENPNTSTRRVVELIRAEGSRRFPSFPEVADE